jgi:hypothetical protein
MVFEDYMSAYLKTLKSLTMHQTNYKEVGMKRRRIVKSKKRFVLQKLVRVDSH